MAQKEHVMGLGVRHTSRRFTKADWAALHVRMSEAPMSSVDVVAQLRTLSTAPPAAPPDRVLAGLATVPTYAAPNKARRALEWGRPRVWADRKREEQWRPGPCVRAPMH